MLGEQNCDELREALREARARMRPPQHTAYGIGSIGLLGTEPRDLTPDADPELQREIQRIQRAMRDAGCDEE